MLIIFIIYVYFKIMRKNNFLEKDNYHFKLNKFENLNFSF